MAEPATVFYGSTRQDRAWVYSGCAPLDKNGQGMRTELQDPRFAHRDGRVRMSRTVDDVEIHWNRNTWTGESKGFTCKDG